MIIFQPTYTFKKIATVDLDALGSVFNQLFIEVTGYERNAIFKLGVTKTNCWSYYTVNKITIARNACKNVRTLIRYLLHEFRHWIQYIHFKDKEDADSPNYDKYYNAPCEKDARKFEILAEETYKLYETLVNIKKIIKTNELWYYNRTEENV